MKSSPVALLIVVFLFFSCSTYVTQQDLDRWKADSENVTQVSILVDDDGDEHCPQLIGDDLLLFASKKNSNTDLWMINMKNKSGMSQLTTYDGFDGYPCAHPDGKHYCFISDRSGLAIYMGELGKPIVTTITDIDKPSFGGWASGDISPDGSTLLYVSGKYIWTYNFTTNRKTQFLQGSSPSWSPDGKKIIYRKISKQLGDDIVTTIWMMNADGTSQTEIIPASKDFSYSSPKISPNGQKILYLKRKVNINPNGVSYENPDIWMCSINGTKHTQITTHPLWELHPTWINDNKIVFVSERPQSGKIKDVKWDIWELELY